MEKAKSIGFVGDGMNANQIAKRSYYTLSIPNCKRPQSATVTDRCSAKYMISARRILQLHMSNSGPAPSLCRPDGLAP